MKFTQLKQPAMNLRTDTLGRKIGLGYVLMVFVLACATTITILQVNKVNDISSFLIRQRQPSARADLELMNGINRSIAEIRGWTLLQKDTFRNGRKKAWKEEIRPAIASMEELSRLWTNPENIRRLSMLVPLIDQMERYQDEVEALAAKDVTAAVHLMDTKMLPLNEEIRNLVTELNQSHELLMTNDFETISNEISLLGDIEWVLLSIGLLVSIILGSIITRSISAPVAKAVEVAQAIGSGNLSTPVKVGGSKELIALGDSLTNMRDSLLTTKETTEHFDWLTKGQNKLNEAMRGDLETESLCNEISTFLTTYTGANVGAIYLMDDQSQSFKLIGTHAFSTVDTKGEFKLREGLIGQAAADNETILVNSLGETDIRLRSSLVDAVPNYVLATPLLIDNHAIGVLELGKFSEFTAAQREFIETSRESIAIAINSAVSRRKVRELLEKTQRQSEELQQQQEELTQTNEELEEQTQKLKEQQEELQAANEELEEQAQIVEQKNRDLETARTDIELKANQLEISSKYKSEFLANMSHELRTPLNSLLILSNDLASNKTGNLTDDQVESAQVISKGGNDLLTLINEILDLSKVEAGKMDLNLKEVRLDEVAQDMNKNFRRMAEQKGLQFETSISPSLPTTVRSDRQRLEQILKNLISNAIKFTDKGKVSLSFNQEAGGYLTIAVQDTGIGIAKEKQQIVFEAFQQADGGTSRKYGGTGLGLSISRELARLLGGRITLTSIVNQGSTFTLTIPLMSHAKASKKAPERPAPTETSFSQPNALFLNHPTIEDDRDRITSVDHSILIIEDDLEFARLLGVQAHEKGFKFISASSGEDGLLLAGQYRPSAIILDIDLPGIDGHIVLKELKGNPDVRHIPVHIMSVNEKTLDPIRSGAVEYLTKPVTKKQLEQAFGRIEDFVSRRMKNLLIIEDNDDLRQTIVKLIGNGDVKCFQAATGQQALDQFKKQPIDCAVLDLGLPDMSGFELLKELEKVSTRAVPPIIIYTGRELSKKENEELEQYAETIIVKGVKSEERLLDETALFLHRTVRNLPQKKQDMITGLYDTETIFQGKKLLLVDDDMRNVFALSKVLREKGFEIVKAENGKVALEALNKDPDMDMVLMDIMMPEMDGYECMREIRKQKAFATLPVIALTAKAMKDDRQKCIDAGANDYISKPVDVDRLLSLMRIWIKK
ncbi:MAG: response regulator [Flavobacteriales bacterium]